MLVARRSRAPRVLLTVALAALVSSASACNSGRSQSSGSPGPSTSQPSGSTTTVPGFVEPADEWGIDAVPIRIIGHTVIAQKSLRTDGKRLFGTEGVDEDVTTLVRVDPGSGGIVASHPVAPSPKSGAYSTHGPQWTAPGSVVVLLDGERRSISILDPDTLALRHRVELRANTRTVMSNASHADGPFWVGHYRFAEDEIFGRLTYMGASRVDPVTGRVLATHDVAACGARTAMQSGETLVVSVACTGQLEFIDLTTGATDFIAAFQSPPDLGAMGKDVWASWPDLGYIAKIDVAHHSMTALDLNADGPLVRNIGRMQLGDGSLWVSAEPADSKLPHRIVLRIDPATVRVTARAWADSNVVVTDDAAGYGVTNAGQLATFDPADVTRDAPADTVRPKQPVLAEYQPQDADERAAVDAFRLVFDVNVSDAVAAGYIEDGNQLIAVRQKLAGLARQELYRAVTLVVTNVTVNGDKASLTFSFRLNGKPAFATLPVVLIRVSGRFELSRASLCGLAQLAQVTTC